VILPDTPAMRATTLCNKAASYVQRANTAWAEWRRHAKNTIIQTSKEARGVSAAKRPATAREAIVAIV
jgi:hypothetical protein